MICNGERIGEVDMKKPTNRFGGLSFQAIFDSFSGTYPMIMLPSESVSHSILD
jgi:hypothetical protein